VLAAGVDGQILIFGLAAGKVEGKLTGHTALARTAMTGDGKTLATASHDRTIRLWDLTTKTQRMVLTGHQQPIQGIAFAPDGKFLATASGTLTTPTVNPSQTLGEVKLWDVDTGKELISWSGGHYLPSVAFSPDGRTLATAGDSSVKLWDLGKALEAGTLRPTQAAEAQSPPADESAVEAAFDREFDLVVRAVRGLLTADDRKRLLKEDHPLLGQLAEPQTKALLTMLVDLPPATQQELRLRGYVKWKFSSLDAERQKVIRDWFQARLDSTAPRAIGDIELPEAPEGMPDAVEYFEKEGVTGFAVVRLDQPPQKLISWFALMPRAAHYRGMVIDQPTWCTVVGAQAVGTPSCDAAHLAQLTALYRKGNSSLPAFSSFSFLGANKEIAAATQARQSGRISFDTKAKPITQDGVTVEQNAWRIEAKQKRTVLLFEAPDPRVDNCLLTYRAKLKSANLEGGACISPRVWATP
jgi:hypothetical protein